MKNDGTPSELQKAIATAQEKDESDRFRPLYNLVVDDIFRFIRPRVAQRADARDMSQRILVELWKALPRFTYRSDKQFYEFLYTIARRKLARYYKEEKRAGRVRESDYHEPVATMDTEHVSAVSIAHTAMRKLSKKEQDVVILRYWHEYSFAEIGETLSVSEQAARVRHHRAIQKLAKFVAQPTS